MRWGAFRVAISAPHWLVFGESLEGMALRLVGSRAPCKVRWNLRIIDAFPRVEEGWSMMEELMKRGRNGATTAHGSRNALAFACVFLVLNWTAFAAVEDDSDPRTSFFIDVVLPIFETHCYECHHHGSGTMKGGLALDLRAGLLLGGGSGPAIVPGNPDASRLIQAVEYRDLEMPPKERLSDAQIQALRRWIEDGAVDPREGVTETEASAKTKEREQRHWAFQPLRAVEPPSVQSDSWARTPIDRFILASLENRGLSPVRDTDRHTWLRRVTLDLTGLPPSLEEIQAFIGDTSNPSREQVVDRLLDSRAFGERWARRWLDLVGYADQVGTSNNVFARHAWRYRDYVIGAFNRDKPFDQFIREQIAGDLIDAGSDKARAEALVATGFLSLGDLEIVEADKQKLLVDIADQQIAKTGRAFLGLTIECARCHDHKFDPISQEDYYAMAGIFKSTSTIYKTDRGVWSAVNEVHLPATEEERGLRLERIATHDDQIEQLRGRLRESQARRSELDSRLDEGQMEAALRTRLTQERDELLGEIGTLSRRIQHAEFFRPTYRAFAVRDVEAPSDMRITIRGNPRALGASVPRGFLEVLSPTPRIIPEGESGRRELAEWIVESPLMARVAVNRIWSGLIGEGLVRSVDYFGLPGERPSHPEALEYLAGGFVEGGYSVKSLVREIVLSRTYGLSSDHDPRANAVDPENRLLWRAHRRRLDAEAIRDSMLFVSGQLFASSGGPAMPLEYFENVGGLDPADVNPPSFRLAKWRPNQSFVRTFYLPVLRGAPQPGSAALRNVFDFARPSEFTGRRGVTAVPTQALFLLNSQDVKTHARRLAQRVSSTSSQLETQLETLWSLTLNRPITKVELADAIHFVDSGGSDGLVELAHALIASNEFLMRL